MFLTGFLTGLVANLLSLLGATMGRVRKIRVLFRSPGFLVGDFFLLPVYFGLAFVLFAKVSAETVIGVGEIGVVGLVSLVVVITFGKHFRLLKWNWIPHGLFAWLAVLTLFLAVDAVVKEPHYWLYLLGMTLLLILNQVWGAIFPKKL